MTYTARSDTTGEPTQSFRHAMTAFLAVVGIVAVALGAWLAFGPDNGTLTIFGWTWNVADLSDLWAPFLMIGGGVVTALSMGIESVREWGAGDHGWLVGLEALLTVAGIAAVAVGIILLF